MANWPRWALTTSRGARALHTRTRAHPQLFPDLPPTLWPTSSSTAHQSASRQRLESPLANPLLRELWMASSDHQLDPRFCPN